MAQGSREVIASTVFAVVANPGPIVDAYMRNCRGSVNPLVPDTIGAGHWRVFVPEDIDLLRVSITERSGGALGETRNVSTVLSPVPVPPGSPPSTQVDIFVRDVTAPDGTPVDTEPFVEVTLSRLPL